MLRLQPKVYVHDSDLPSRRANAVEAPRPATAGLQPGKLEEKCEWMRRRQAARKGRKGRP